MNALIIQSVEWQDGIGCAYHFYDYTWSEGEEIAISEDGDDLCDGSNGFCEVVVTLIKIGLGGEDDTVLQVLTIIVE